MSLGRSRGITAPEMREPSSERHQPLSGVAKSRLRRSVRARPIAHDSCSGAVLGSASRMLSRRKRMDFGERSQEPLETRSVSSSSIDCSAKRSGGPARAQLVVVCRPWPGSEAQPVAQTAEPLANRLRRHPEDLTELLRVEAVQIPKDQKSAVVRIEIALQQIAGGSRLGRIGGFLPPREPEPVNGAKAAPAATVRAERAVSRDREEPRLLIRDAAQLVAACVRREQGVLQKILRKVAVPDELGKEQGKPAAELLDEPVESGVGGSRLVGSAHVLGRCRKAPMCDIGGAVFVTVILAAVKVVVLGGTRFIGPYVVQLLAEQGHEVTIVHRGETEAELPEAVEHVHTEFPRLSDELDRLGLKAVDVVLDMVPYLDKGGHGVLAFGGIAERGVVITSCDVYRAFGRLWRSELGPPDPVPLTEESPLRSLPAPDAGSEEVAYDNLDVEKAVGGGLCRRRSCVCRRRTGLAIRSTVSIVT